MPYNPNIPQASDDPRNSQGELLQNFQQINSDYAVNHTSLTASGQNGYHTKIFFADPLGADPNLVAPESSLYTKTVAGLTELFFQNGALASNVKQLTNLPITTAGTTYGFDTPWGWRVNMGLTSAATTNFALAYDPAYTLYYASCSKNASGNTPTLGAITNTQINITFASNTYFLVIGSIV